MTAGDTFWSIPRLVAGVDYGLSVSDIIEIEQKYQTKPVAAVEGIGNEVNAMGPWRVQYVSMAKQITTQVVPDAPPGLKYALKITVVEATNVEYGDFLQVYQSIPYPEGGIICDEEINNSPLFVWFWIKSSLTGTFGFALNNSSGTRNRTTSFSISTANTWQHVFFPDIGRDINGIWEADGHGTGGFVQICMASGAKYQTDNVNQWQDGDFLMQSGITNGQFLNTSGATFSIAGLTVRRK